jgi:hypothetical protein
MLPKNPEGSVSMALKTEKILCKFVGDFKVGDNMKFNADLLCKLNDTNNDGSFNKLMLIQAAAILEAGLTEIIYRAKLFTREGVVNIPDEDLAAIREKKIEKFAVIIDVMKKHKLLDAYREGVYDELHKLRKYRNKVHIQEDVEIDGEKPSRDESVLFSNAIRDWSLTLTAAMLKFLTERFPRPKDKEVFAHELTLPCP